MTPVATAETLVLKGRYSEALKVIDGRPVPGEDRIRAEVLKVEVLERIGEYARSRTSADRLLRGRQLNAVQRALCELALGYIAFDEGNVEEATTHFQRAVTAAKAGNDLRTLCWCQLRLMNVLAERSGQQAIATLLSQVRRNVTRHGDAVVSAALHILMGEMEAKRGLIDNAGRHTRLGLNLLHKDEHLWLEGVAENTLMALSIMQSDLDSGIVHGQRAVHLALSSGANALKRAALGNLGNVYFVSGHLEKAREYLLESHRMLPTSGALSNGALESLATLHLADGNIEAASSLLVEMHASVRSPADWMIYANRHSRLTLADVMARQGRAEDALHEVEIALQLADRAGDRQLHIGALLMKAQLMASAGRAQEVKAILRTINLVPFDQGSDAYPRYERTLSASLALSGNIEAARFHFRRSNRTFRGLRNIPGQLELSRVSIETLGIPFPDSNQSVKRCENSLQNIAALLLHAGRPELLAIELVAILEDVDGIVSVDATSRGADGSCETLATFAAPAASGEAPSITHTFSLGTARNRGVQVDVRIHDDIEPIAVLNAVTLLLGVVRDLERARAERDERLTLWPLEDLPPGGSDTIVMGRLGEVMTFARRIASTTVGVLITGESGTGKEILARAIHRYSARADRPFVPFNCAAIPREMLESQLFGHRRGAFTGADRDNPGVIRAAKDGTLLLDEVGDLSPELQPKLLRFLESGEICPLGEPCPLNVDVRVIAATNANLEQLVEAGRFREDLYYRLNVIRLNIPPLRERRDEIPALVHHFVAKAAQEFGKVRIRVAEETMEHLLLYPWPGNVRQLNNELRRMVALADSDTTLTPATLSRDILRATPKGPARNGSPEISIPLTEKLVPTLWRIEREMIKAALKSSEGKVDAAARALGISRKGLYLKRQRLGV
jgi:DNA-binding NtrC family response regulator/tetratricopeptide (TPR) repeat protein